MAGIEKLSALKVARVSKPGKYGDGNGLYLQVTKQLVKSWIFRYTIDGRERYMGLGAVHTVGLAEAREEARKARLQLSAGIDPLQARQQALARNRAAKLSNRTFSQCMSEYIASHKESWKSSKHAKQWEATLNSYACPHFGKTNVREVNTALVLKALKPIWKIKTETATRLRERIERVLSWAATSGYREGENPARWHGHLQELLPKPSKLKTVQHHPALAHQQIGDFYRALAAEKGLGARALQLTILTACRTSEVILARWQEIDLDRRVWIIPGERMKRGREHRVPLVPQSITILRRLEGQDATLVFPGSKEGKSLSNMAMLNVLKRMGRSELTVHGFRSTFRVWGAEQTTYSKEMLELALAHAVGTAVEAAYQRSDLFERRRALMQDWAQYCNVVRPLSDGDDSQELLQGD